MIATERELAKIWGLTLCGVGDPIESMDRRKVAYLIANNFRGTDFISQTACDCSGQLDWYVWKTNGHSFS